MPGSAACPPSLPGPRRHAAARHWNDDWDRLVASPEARTALVRWRTDPRLVATDLPALLVAAGAGGSGRSLHDEPDHVLGALVSRAAADRVAARVVLQRVLPGLLVVARRRSRSERRVFSDVLADVAATAWTVIVTYPVERRPAKFAANIVRDTEYLCFVQARRLRRVIEELSATDGLEDLARGGLDGRPEDVAPNPSEAVAALLAEARSQGLSADDEQLLRALYVDDRAVEAVAGHHAIGARALRYRRTKAIRRLARLAA